VSSTNEFGQPVGEIVPDWAPCPFPDVTVMRGRYATVEPLLPHHTRELYAVLCGPEQAALWTWLPREMPADELAFADLVDELSSTTDEITMMVRDAEGRAGGMFSLLRIDRAHGSAEIGWVVLGHDLQRTTAATEAIYLLARHVFNLGYRRLEWKCDSLNEASRRAAQRLGFRHDGTFRKHRVVKGRNRDTDWFSITDDEWPRCARAFELWLDPANQVDGKQVRPLTALRDEL